MYDLDTWYRYVILDTGMWYLTLYLVCDMFEEFAEWFVETFYRAPAIIENVLEGAKSYWNVGWYEI